MAALGASQRCAHRALHTAVAFRARQRRSTLARVDKTDDEGREGNVGRYCSIDSSGKRIINKSLLEKENDFLEALQSYYYNGESRLTDDEFELLKDDLIWSGSQIAVLSSNEQRFLEAMRAYTRGDPILSDEEYDDLKNELVKENSVVTRAGPRCSIRSRRMYSDANPDYLKLTLINAPAALLVLGFIFSIDDLTGFEITKAIQLPPPYSILFLWGLVFPTIYILASSITNFILPDALILKADCPSCNTTNQAYFGGIFSVAGNKETTTVECPNCLADLEFNAKRRSVLVRTTPEDKQKQEEEKKAKKAASAKKKAAKAAKKEESAKEEASKEESKEKEKQEA